jgi:hypothetical protein
VTFTLRDGEVLIPAEARSPLLDAVRGSVVAFEADDYDASTRTGWTVTVLGPSRVLEDREEGSLIAVRAGLVRGWRTSTPSLPCTG